MDEPTAYLDVKYTRNLIKIFKRIYRNGTTLLMATHDLDLVARWADWIFVMDGGKLFLEGLSEDAFMQGDLLEKLRQRFLKF